MKKIKLFCLPHAGGVAMYYSQWKRQLNKSIEIIPLELSGRGRRMSEGFYNNFDQAIKDLFSQIRFELGDCDFAFFGHSMGSILAYELTYKIIEMKNQEPIDLFLSGRYPPHIIKNKKNLHLLADKDFIEEIVKYGGMPSEVLQEKSLMQIITPILRADFKVLDTYEYIKKDYKLNCDIVTLTGKDDEGAQAESLVQWKEHTNGNCYMHEFEGNHFYINDNVNKIINIINEKILEIPK